MRACVCVCVKNTGSAEPVQIDLIRDMRRFVIDRDNNNNNNNIQSSYKL